MDTEILTTDIPGLKLVSRGKVRDVYAVDDNRMLIVTTDRVSAYDVIMGRGVPGRGKILTALSVFWFDFLKNVTANHLLEHDIRKMPAPLPSLAHQLAGRVMLVKRASIYPVECVVRGYIIGSGWKDYQKTGAVCGIALPTGLKQAARLETPIFTPATKAEQGEHDENISFATACEILGTDRATELRDRSLAIYRLGRDYAAKRGVILADTKFEFGAFKGETILCDEVLTPDSSRFWDAAEYREGISPPSFDKQILRDWLETQPWNKQAPAPVVPDAIIERTLARYREVADRLMG